MNDLEAASEFKKRGGMRAMEGGMPGAMNQSQPGVYVQSTPEPESLRTQPPRIVDPITRVPGPEPTLRGASPAPTAAPSYPVSPNPGTGTRPNFTMGGGDAPDMRYPSPAVRVPDPSLGAGASPINMGAAEIVQPPAAAGAHPNGFRDAFGSGKQWGELGGKVGDVVGRAADRVGEVVNRAGRVAGRIAAPLGAVMGAKDLYEGARDGDALKAGLGATDVAATGALLTPAAPAAAAYLGVRGAYQGGKLVGGAISDNLSQNASDTVGQAINFGVRSAGRTLGQDWGVDNTAYEAQRAQERLRLAAPAGAGAGSAQPRSFDTSGVPAQMEGLRVQQMNANTDAIAEYRASRLGGPAAATAGTAAGATAVRADAAQGRLAQQEAYPGADKDWAQWEAGRGARESGWAAQTTQQPRGGGMGFSEQGYKGQPRTASGALIHGDVNSEGNMAIFNGHVRDSNGFMAPRRADDSNGLRASGDNSDIMIDGRVSQSLARERLERISNASAERMGVRNNAETRYGHDSQANQQERNGLRVAETARADNAARAEQAGLKQRFDTEGRTQAQSNWNQEQGLRVDQNLQAQDKVAFDQRGAGSKVLMEEVQRKLPPVKNSKGDMVADERGSARFMTAADKLVAQNIRALENSSSPQDVADARNLRDRGPAALDSVARNELYSGLRMSDAYAKENKKWFGSDSGKPAGDDIRDFRVTGVSPNGKRVMFANGTSMNMSDIPVEDLPMVNAEVNKYKVVPNPVGK